MNKTQRDHLLQVVSVLTKETKFAVLGSQAAVLALDNPPKKLLSDPFMQVFIPGFESPVDLIDTTLDQDSPFYDRFGYGVTSVEEDMFPMPEGWEDRATLHQTATVNGFLQVTFPTLADTCAMEISQAAYTDGDKADLEWVHALLEAKALDVRAIWSSTVQIPDGENLDPILMSLASEHSMDFDPEKWTNEMDELEANEP